MTGARVRELLFGTWRGRISLGVLGLFIFMAIFGSAIAPDDPDASSLEVLQPPSSSHLLGTTESGSDVLSQLLVGARVSIVVGFAAAIISAVIGAAVGLFSGYFGGWTDRILDAVDNWFLVIPTLPLMIVLSRLLNPSLGVLILVIGITSWAGTGPDRPLAGADPARARLRRARPRAGREPLVHHPHAHLPERAAADLRQHGPDRRRRDPLRGGARPSSASATRPRSPGGRCSRTRSRRAPRAPRRGGT